MSWTRGVTNRSRDDALMYLLRIVKSIGLSLIHLFFSIDLIDDQTSWIVGPSRKSVAMRRVRAHHNLLFSLDTILYLLPLNITCASLLFVGGYLLGFRNYPVCFSVPRLSFVVPALSHALVTNN